MPTLAQAQLKQDQIRAAKAQQVYQSALDDTLSVTDVNATEKVVKKLVAEALQALKAQFNQAIEGESDETQVHYLLSDTAHDWLNGLGHTVKENLASNQAGLVFNKAIKPKDLLTVSQCAEKYRYIKTGTNQPGPWRNENAPHTVEIMDALSIHSPTKRVTFKKASGISGTEVWLNWLLYIVKHAEKDVMIAVPDMKGLEKTFIPRIRKMFKETPALKELYDQRTQRDKDTEEVIEIGEVKITLAQATSVNSFRAEHVPYTITDEKSAMPLMIGTEGDVGMLTDNRTKTFTRRKKFDVSSPTTEDFCQISDDFEEGSQEWRHIYCPACNHCHTLEFKNFRWTKSPVDAKAVTDAWFTCPSCTGRIEEHQKNDLLDNAVWIAKHPERKKEHRSFTVNSFYIKYGLGLTWREIAELWLKAQGDTPKLVTFTNTYLAETSKIEAEGIEANSLLSRLEAFPGDMPPVIRLFGGDVQKDRIEVTISDYENTKESWAQEHIILPGTPEEEDDQVWIDFENEMKARSVDFGCLDSSYLSKQVYKFCKTRKWCHPIQGKEGMSRPFTEDKMTRAKKLRTRSKYGVKPEILGVDTGKTLVHSRLNMDSTTTYDFDEQTGEILEVHRPSNPGYIHFRNAGCFDAEYFEQLTAEQLQTKKRKGRKLLEWVAIRARNEAFDCMVYLAAAFDIAMETKKIRFSQKPKIEDFDIESLKNHEAQEQEQPTKPTRQRRTVRMRGRQS